MTPSREDVVNQAGDLFGEEKLEEVLALIDQYSARKWMDAWDKT